MGRLWSSSKEPSAPTSSSPYRGPSNSSNPPPPSIPDTPPSETTPSTTTSQPPDTELEAFLSSLRPSSSQPPKRPIPGFSTPTLSTSPSTAPISSSSSDLITPQVLYPTTLSCRSAFDTAFYCASLGGQFTNIYRYGSLRRCSDEWAEFWWCVRTNRGFMSDEERKVKVVGRAREKENRRYRDGGSSEDVWEGRRVMVRGAFQGDFWAASEEHERLEREKEGGMGSGGKGGG